MRKDKRDYRVTIIFIWLVVLTFMVMYDKINTASRLMILPPPILEPIPELDVECEVYND